MFRRKSLNELNAEHPLSDAFFDYNQNELREDARQALQHDAEWLAKWPQTAVRVDGHCDERGTAEYNLALGDKRAMAAQEFLTNMGVPTNQLKVISFGKERPLCTDSTESCWQKNRRVHIAAAR